MHLLEFPIDLQNADISPLTLLKNRRSPNSFNNSQNTHRKHLQKSHFSVELSGWIGKLKLFTRHATKDVFLGILVNFKNSSFMEYPLKIV